MDSRPTEGPGVAGNAAALLTGRLAAGIGSVLATPFLYTRLGPNGFGLWALLLGTLAIAGLADFGFGSAQVREVARAAATGGVRRAQATLALGLLYSAAVGLALLVFVGVGWPLFARTFHIGNLAGEARVAAFLLIGAFTLDGLASPWRAALEGKQRMRPVAAITATTALAGTGAGVAVVALGFGMRGLAWSALTACVLRTSLLFAAGRRWAPEMKPSFRAIDARALRGVFRYGSRVQMSNGAAAINNDTDRLVLGAFFSPAMVTPFDLGSKLANLLRLAPSYVIMAVFPAATVLHAHGERGQLDRLYLRTTRYLTLFAAVAASALAVSAAPLITLWIGRPVPLAATTVALLAFGYAVNLASGGAAAVTRAEGVPGRETRYALVAAGLNGALTIPLLLLLGPMGVPLSTTIAYVAATAYFFWHFHRASDRALKPLLRVGWKPFAASGFAAALVWVALGSGAESVPRPAAALAALTRGGLAVVISTGALAVLGFFDAEDRAVLRRVLVRVRLRNSAPVPAPASGGSL